MDEVNPVKQIMGDKYSFNKRRKHFDNGYDREKNESDQGGKRCDGCGKFLHNYNTSVYTGLCTTCYGKNQ